MLFYVFYKSEHLVGTFVVFGIFVILRTVALVFERISVVFAEELDDVKAELVDVKMDIPLLEIRRAGLPYDGIGIKALDLLPRGGADALAVNVGRYEQDLKFIVLCLLVDLQDQPADDFAVLADAVGDAVVNAMFDGPPRDDLAVAVKVVVAHAEFFDCTVFEGVLIVEDELLAVVFGKVCKGDVCCGHKCLLNKMPGTKGKKPIVPSSLDILSNRRPAKQTLYDPLRYGVLSSDDRY